MKVQTVNATLPLLDWRVLRGSKYRIPAIDLDNLGKHPFLKGFGRFGHRSTVNIPWRDSETGFFEANRAIQLPRHLPGGNAAQHILRRIYISGPQIRFDLAAFATIHPDRLKEARYRRAASQWWLAPVRMRHGSVWTELQLHVALRKLAGRFEDETQPRDETKAGSLPSDPRSVSDLQPQILLICIAKSREIPSTAVMVLDNPPIWYSYDSRFKGDPQPDLAFVFVAEDAVRQMGVGGFSKIRRIRRELGWLHADLQFLLEVARAVKRRDPRVNSSLLVTASAVADGLSQLDEDEAYGFSPLLFAAWSEARANMLALLRKQIGISLAGEVPLPKWLAGQVRHQAHDRQRIYNLTVDKCLEHKFNDYYSDTHALQLGRVALVDKQLLEGEATRNYIREQSSVLLSYAGLPRRERKQISIVVPIRGDVFPLIACLESIAGQTLVRECPEDIEILLIEDGPLDTENPVVSAQDILAVLERIAWNKVAVRRFILRFNKGRATARNVGIFNAKGKILMFVDTSMILDHCHLAEHVVRHHRISNIALLGFKENVRLPSYTIESYRAFLAERTREADPRGDWKWGHVIAEDELENGIFRSKSSLFRKGETINYMRLTDYLGGLSAIERIGPRTLATFFQTNIVSAPTVPVREVGGFHSLAFKDGLWSLEDSHLGALLLTIGIRLVPCPSAKAFKIEHDEDPEERQFALEHHRQLYEELLSERIGLRAHEAEEELTQLKSSGGLSELDPVCG